MKTGFKDRLEVKEGKKIKSSFNYEQPPYDERSSCYVNAGTNYGVGKNQPVGTFKASGYAVPIGRVQTLDVDKIYSGIPEQVEIED